MHETSSGIPNVQAAQSSKEQTWDEVLVCAYGSYNYLYADPVKCYSEFENIFKKNNGNYKEIFHKSLEWDLFSSRSSISKGRGSKSKESTEDTKSKIIKNAWF